MQYIIENFNFVFHCGKSATVVCDLPKLCLKLSPKKAMLWQIAQKIIWGVLEVCAMVARPLAERSRYSQIYQGINLSMDALLYGPWLGDGV
jgi:hypothetical protein